MLIGVLAKAADVPTATINFYVGEGILPPPRRLNPTRSAYGRVHLRLLAIVRAMQSAGSSLAEIKAAIQTSGTDRNGIKKLEGMVPTSHVSAHMGATGAPWPQRAPPLTLEALVASAGSSTAVVKRLLQLGLLRPAIRDRFDERDLAVARTIQRVIDDGIAMEQLESFADLIDVARRALPIVMQRATRADRVPSERRTFRELLEAHATVLEYLVERAADEADPARRALLRRR